MAMVVGMEMEAQTFGEHDSDRDSGGDSDGVVGISGICSGELKLLGLDNEWWASNCTLFS